MDKFCNGKKAYNKDIVTKIPPNLFYFLDLVETLKILDLHDLKLNLAKCIVKLRSKKFLWFMIMKCKIEIDPKNFFSLLEMCESQHIKLRSPKIESVYQYIMDVHLQIYRNCLPFFKTLKVKTHDFNWILECQVTWDILK